MPFGYMGKICCVDLSSGTVTVEHPGDRVYRGHIGGEGLGAWMLYHRQAPGADPMGSENHLGFVSGLLSGCRIPAASRTTVVTKSPLTGTWGDSNIGGRLGPEIKACGFDAIFFKGISPTPVYLSITGENVELKDAAHLWGKDTEATAEILRRESGNAKLQVAAIGPAGEKCSLISSIMCGGRAAARSGVGAVMGSKRLKAVALSGNKKVPLADENRIKSLRKQFTKNLMESDYFVIKTLRESGTCGLVSLGTKLGIAPAKNWSASGEEGFPAHAKLDGEMVKKYHSAGGGCAGCPIACGGTVKIDSGPYKGVETRKPEYETIVSFGNMCLNQDLESIIKAEDVCDRYGIDTISTGTVIAFAIECFENGLIDEQDTGGLALSWGDSRAILELLDKIVNRDGFGDVLADGVKRAAQRIGKGSEAYAVHIHGQEMPYHDFRYELPGRAVTYISDPTPARHERFTGGQILELDKSLGPEPELQSQTGSHLDHKELGQILARGTMYYEVFVSCGMCAFTMSACHQFPLAEIIAAATGWDFTASQLLQAGARIQSLRQAFNIREGIRHQSFEFPERLRIPPAFEGPMRGPYKEYNYQALRDSYFHALGWNPETGEPALPISVEIPAKEKQAT